MWNTVGIVPYNPFDLYTAPDPSRMVIVRFNVNRWDMDKAALWAMANYNEALAGGKVMDDGFTIQIMWGTELKDPQWDIGIGQG